MHYIFITLIISVIVFIQLKSYFSNRAKLRTFRAVFPDNHSGFRLNMDKDRRLVLGIESFYHNPVLKTILSSVNNYLSNNKGAVSDFHIIKDVVDRNCDAVEEEINAQIPIPLYYGLMGTMAGILIGIGFLVAGGGLNELLNSDPDGNGVEGVKMLMGGVALAMVSSIMGIGLTTAASSHARQSKAVVEKNKNIFLSWIQSVLLPELSSDTTAAFEKLAANLFEFNKTFSANNAELREALQQINASYKGQAEVLEAINRMKIAGIATANISVYEKLKDCTDEIGQLGSYFQHVNEYLANVKQLNENLDRNETRSRAVEAMGVFFKEEVSQIEARKATISKSVGTVDAMLQKALELLKENTEQQFNELTKASVKQQTALQKKLEETSEIVSELHNLTAVKNSMSLLNKATTEQNKKLDRLTDAIQALAESKASGELHFSLPLWLKVSMLGGAGLLLLACGLFVYFVLTKA